MIRDFLLGWFATKGGHRRVYLVSLIICLSLSHNLRWDFIKFFVNGYLIFLGTGRQLEHRWQCRKKRASDEKKKRGRWKSRWNSPFAVTKPTVNLATRLMPSWLVPGLRVILFDDVMQQNFLQIHKILSSLFAGTISNLDRFLRFTECHSICFRLKFNCQTSLGLFFRIFF